MKTIAFIDIETSTNDTKAPIKDIGALIGDDKFHQNAIKELSLFLSKYPIEFICGHNFINHDFGYLKETLSQYHFNKTHIIDTLLLSCLLFPARPYHALNKNYKIQFEESNSPINDAIITKDLLADLCTAFDELNGDLKDIYYGLLKNIDGFSAFFKFKKYQPKNTDIITLIYGLFANDICEQADLELMIDTRPVELAYCLALIFVHSRHCITPSWAKNQYPHIDTVMSQLRNTPCSGCCYCNQYLNAKVGLKRYFGFDDYRSYDGKPLQLQAVESAIQGKSILAIFPTGGGKSITFQVPALMSGENEKGLTVVISPLQSLMKDQVDNLENKGITEAVTINGLLNTIERQKAFERIQDGLVSILYISPESLRSGSIESLLLSRKISRFVIDEAHCFSSWGHDFRVDYLYIADFIKNLQAKKANGQIIPISCFTATAKRKVVKDICDYFKDNLNLHLEIFGAKVTRKNLSYEVLSQKDDDEKYNSLRRLIEQKNCPTIVYVSRTKRTLQLVEKLNRDGFNAKAYHGKMNKEEKSTNQESFISGETQIMVATSAFGMGVDKSDVGAVIHYEISDSLENYVQEAGRAGRDEKLNAECFILFNEDDLNKHFMLLNQTKITIEEIKQIWTSIKKMMGYHKKMSYSALEIARNAGWNDDIDSNELETRVKIAINALENVGYIKRGKNIPRVFANSIVCKNAQEAIEIINNSQKIKPELKEKAIRIIKKLFSQKSRRLATDEKAESRVDYISDHLGVVREEVIKILGLLRQENILSDNKDLTAYIKQSSRSNHSMAILNNYYAIESALIGLFDENNELNDNIKNINQVIESLDKHTSPYKIKNILNFYAIKKWVTKAQAANIFVKLNKNKSHFLDMTHLRYDISKIIIDYLYEQKINAEEKNSNKENILVEFSVCELIHVLKEKSLVFNQIDGDDVEDALFYLSYINAITIDGGFLVIYNKLSIERLEMNNQKQYTKEDYKYWENYYNSKIE